MIPSNLRQAVIDSCDPDDSGHIHAAFERNAAEVEAKGRSEERAAIVAFLRAEADKFDKASHDRTLPEHSQERCSVRAALLETEIAYLTRGDHEVPR